MARATADFELIVGDTPTPGTKAATRHPVQVSSPAGPGFAEIDLDPDAPEWKNLLSAAAAVAPALELRQQAGEKLFRCLVPPDDDQKGWKVRSLWAGSVREMGAEGVLRVRLWFRNPALAALPWELLYTNNRFLATDVGFTLSRYLAGPEPSYLDPVPRLRVLGVVSSPTKNLGNLERIPDEELSKFRATFEKLAPKGQPAARLEYTPLDNPGLDAVRTALNGDDGGGDNHHVLHYLGHGVPNQLIFTTKDGSPEPLKVENLRQITLGRRTLRVVVLSACASAQAGAADVFAGVGPALVQVGVPAVVAMQYSHVYVDVAVRFTDALYGSLAAGKPVDVAVTEARQAVSAADIGDRGWSTPVLYLGTRGGRVIELAAGPGAAGDDPVARLRQAVAEAADAQQAFNKVTETLSDLTARLDAITQARRVAEHLGRALGAADRWARTAGGPGGWFDQNRLPDLRDAWTNDLLPPVEQAVADVAPAAAWPAHVKAAQAKVAAVIFPPALALGEIGKALTDLREAVAAALRDTQREVDAQVDSAGRSGRDILSRFSAQEV